MAQLTTLARPYAKAAFQAAREQDSLSDWAEMLVVGAQYTADEDMRELLNHPGLPEHRKAEFLINLYDEPVSDAFKNFVNILAERQRLTLLSEISSLYDSYWAETERRVGVEVSSSYELTDDQQNTLKQALSKRLDRQVHLTATVDQSLIGGVIIRAGDTVIDASVRGKIAKLANAIGS